MNTFCCISAMPNKNSVKLQVLPDFSNFCLTTFDLSPPLMKRMLPVLSIPASKNSENITFPIIDRQSGFVFFDITNPILIVLVSLYPISLLLQPQTLVLTSIS